MIYFIKSFSPFIGQGCLLGASVSAFLGSVANSKRWSISTFSFISLAFIFLLWAHITSDFSYLNVVQHSHTSKPFLYKVTGVWASHEGSMLLWVLFLSFYSLIASVTLPVDLKAPTERILACLILGFLSFVILACDPFTIILDPPIEGEDLNPLLQDPSLAIHPPILYLGQTGFCIPFALSLVVLIQKKISNSMINWIRLFTIIAWSFLTTGLALGSFWAYYELGWGGWWFWDPVENIALLPWLTATALIHSLASAQKQQTLRNTSLFLGILTFSFCLFGLFFVRSGLLTSIHSFAVAPERGYFLLALWGLFSLPGFFLWVVRFRFFRSSPILSPWSQSGLIVLNGVFLLSGAATLLLAIVYPLILGWFGDSLTIGTSYFQATFIPMMLPLVLLMGMGVWAPYFRASLIHIFKKFLPIGIISISSVILGRWVLPNASLLALLMLGASIWLMGSSFLYIINNRMTFKVYAVGMAHFGVGLMILGMVWASQGDVEKEIMLKMNQSTKLAGYTLTLNCVDEKDGPNYKARRAIISVLKEDELVTTLQPERRYYWTQEIIHTEASLYSTFLSHLHATLLEDGKDSYRLRFYYKPLINLLWLGVFLMLLGGICAVLNRLKKITALMTIMLIPAFAETTDENALILYKKITCPVCSGQTLADSDVEDAVVIKANILKKLQNGKSESEIIQDLVEVYGKKIMRDPPLNKRTIPLWFLPWALLLGVISVILSKGRHKLR